MSQGEQKKTATRRTFQDPATLQIRGIVRQQKKAHVCPMCSVFVYLLRCFSFCHTRLRAYYSRRSLTLQQKLRATLDVEVRREVPRPSDGVGRPLGGLVEREHRVVPLLVLSGLVDLRHRHARTVLQVSARLFWLWEGAVG